MKIVVVLFFFLLAVAACAQPACPPNIGFETGNFENWQPMNGNIAGDGTISVGRGIGFQYLVRSDGNTETDPFGHFPVISPNGSRYSVRMGHDMPGTNVDQMVYAFTIPSQAFGFSIIFNYAVVLQNPNHQEHEQPRFTVKVYNETRSSYIECSSFDFVAGYNQPDFLVSDVSRTVFYKPWSSASINLGAFRGEKLRLEFSVNDCSLGGHFGYAYFDVMEKCTNSITGNVICPGMDNVTLAAPPGFAGYEWYTGDFSRQLAGGNPFPLSAPAIGDSFAVVLVPYDYLGCRDTFYTKITSVADPIQLVVKDTVTGCDDTGADLTRPEITRGSSASLQFEYFTDPAAITHLTNPQAVMSSGVYYIKATNGSGCTQTKPVALTIFPVTPFTVTEPPERAYPETVNLATLPDNPQLSYTYWENSTLTKPVLQPVAVSQSGLYYIRGTNPYNCPAVRAVQVKIKPLVFVPNAFSPNRDGKNDRFVYKALGGLKQIAFFKIYNRWGQEIFHSSKPEEGWDGSFRGKPAESGTYVWILKATDWQNQPYQAKGTVVLIR